MSVTSQDGTPRPFAILAHPGADYTAATARALRRLNWDVGAARTADEVRQLARLRGPELIVLSADLAGESGWLTCEKLLREFPGVKVVLVADEPTPALERFAAFVGAAGLVGTHSAPAALLDVVRQGAAV